MKPGNKLSHTVDGTAGEPDIAQLWRQKYKDLFNCVPDSRSDIHVNPSESTAVAVSFEEICLLREKLSSNKAKGYDNIPAEVYKYAPAALMKLLARLFSLMLRYRFLPKNLMKVMLVPIMKCKTGNPMSSSNYRPIAITTAASKLLELIIQYRISGFMQTSCSQFGFKSEHGCDMAIFSFKQCVNYYVNAGSPIFSCFLDASKAFDRVNHRKLFEKLRSRGLPLYIIEFLSYWYASQEYVVKWGSSFSTSFRVTNGIKQGGLTSPILYNVYTNELNERLKESKVGCHISGVCVNHISYADDLIVLADAAECLL